ncbi:MAG: choice-of-anchor I family protein [Pseudomonadota bacterium]
MLKSHLLAGIVLIGASTAVQSLDVEYIGSFGPGIEGGAEIAAFDPASARLFVTNSENNLLDIYDLTDPTAPITLPSVSLAPFGNGPNSVAVANGIVAVAIEADPAQDPGNVTFFDINGTQIGQVAVGPLPDMVTFTPDGQTLVVANEGEPDDDYVVDPEGSISIVDLSMGVGMASVSTASFTNFNEGGLRGGQLPPDLRIFGPGATVAQDLEPEYITVSEDGQTAWVSLQENNGLAVVDIPSATITNLFAFGFKDHSLAQNAFDASDEDGPGGDPGINIKTWPVLGMYQPDSITSFTFGGVPYVLTANEGDARDYDGFSEEERLRDVALDATAFPNAATLQLDENLGRLNITTATGDDEPDGDLDEIYAYGARSFSVWNGLTGQLVWDSGSELEDVTAALGLPLFNDDDGRSDNKGPEPEGIDAGFVDTQRFAFIGLERVDGFFVYEVTDPTNPQLVRFVEAEDTDEAPEGVLFVEAADTPTGNPWLLLTFEDTGTIGLYELTGNGLTNSTPIPVLDAHGLALLIGVLLAFGWVSLRRLQ